MNFSEDKMVKRLVLGDQEVFEELYRFFFPKLTYFSNQYLHDSSLSESIVQDAFTELWAGRKALQDNTNVQAWLFTVVKNKSLKQIDRARSSERYQNYFKSRQLDLNYKLLDQFDTSDFVFEELRTKISQTLDMLSPSVRIVFEKSRFEEKKNKEIAAELGISLKTVEAHVSKALKLLREELREYLPLIFILFFSK